MPNFRTTWMKDIRGNQANTPSCLQQMRGSLQWPWMSRMQLQKTCNQILPARFTKTKWRHPPTDILLSPKTIWTHHHVSQVTCNPWPSKTHKRHPSFRSYMTDSQWVWILLFNISLELTWVWPLPPTSETWQYDSREQDAFLNYISILSYMICHEQCGIPRWNCSEDQHARRWYPGILQPWST
jgi:hypothetical protein